jgi:hypothetical protein
MKFSNLVEHVSKKPIPPHVKHLIVEVMVSDEEGEDVEVCISLFPVLLRTLNKPILGTIYRYPNLNVLPDVLMGEGLNRSLVVLIESIETLIISSSKSIKACVVIIRNQTWWN